ncbi:MAG: glycosyltransferase, partial [Candidatus Pacebacteria bacterium]|nr:glycosyltransferase [Candidatus Paceibacterota bacterium]
MLDEKKIKVALVHDFLIQFGGAERFLEALAEMFPAAPIYTILYDPEKMRGKFAGRDIRTSFFQKLPKCLRKRYKFLLPLLPTAPETFDLRDFDLVISSSGAWSKGIVTRLNTIHIAYIHSPMRFVWDYNEKYLQEERKRKFGLFIRPLFSYFRLWDKLAADRPDYLIANSKYTQA